MVYKWYILPIGGLCGTYHPLREPGNSIDFQAPKVLFLVFQNKGGLESKSCFDVSEFQKQKTEQKKRNKKAGELLCENLFLQGHVSDVFLLPPKLEAD